MILNEPTRCNAVLISDTVLVTAGHCTFGIRPGDFASWAASYAEANLSNSIRIRNTFRFPNPYADPTDQDFHYYSQDIGFIQLESPTRTPPVAIDFDRTPEPGDLGTGVSFGGEAAERRIGTMRLKRMQHDGWVYGRGPATDVLGEPGDSGAALLSREGRLLGVISGGANGETCVARLKLLHLAWLWNQL